GVTKTISVLHKYEESIRIFVCREFTDTHYLEPGKPQTITKHDVQLREIHQTAQNTNSPIEILAVVWGSAIITDSKVYQRIYDAYANKVTVQFTNAWIGGENDPWRGNHKSGAIYYRLAGRDIVRQISGKEHDKVHFLY